MSRLSPCHEGLDELGRGKCSVPMFCGMGGDAGFCNAPAYGKPPPGKVFTRWDGHTYRVDGRYAGYVPGLACIAHGGPNVRTFMDGNAWCAVKPDFIDLQASVAGFGDTHEAAIADLTQRAKAQAPGGDGDA